MSLPANDWYALLAVPPTAATEEIAAAAERLSRQATALAVTAPERARILRDQVRALRQDLLSGPAQRQAYDQRLAAQAPPRPVAAHSAQQAAAPYSPGPASAAPFSPGPASAGAAPYPPGPAQPAAAPYGAGPPHPAGQPAPGSEPLYFPAAQPAGPSLMARFARFLQTGWTCPSCGHGALPGDKFCQKCGTPIQVPSAGPPSQATQATGRPSFCGKCGAQIAPGNTFCTQCGAQRA